MKIFTYLLIASAVFFLSVTLLKKEDNRNALFKDDEISLESFLNGDIIFQSGNEGQSKAIQLATKSKLTHCGILFKENEKWMVLEAVQPVCITPFSKWIQRGDDQAYWVKRLKDHQIINDSVSHLMLNYGKSLLGEDYDVYFAWDDSEWYCSELVYKIYERILGVKLCELKPLKNYDLSHPYVKEIMKPRYGDKIPFEALMVAPSDLYSSKYLVDL